MLYYFISIILVFNAILVVFNQFYLRFTGKTTFGQNYPHGSKEYEKIDYVINRKVITITSVIATLLVVNLVYSAWQLFRINTPDANFILWFAPIIVIVISVLVYYASRNKM